MEEVKKISAIAADEGQKLMIAGGEYRIILSGKETGGSFAVIEMSVPPGAGPAPHAHPDFEESFYVLEGEVNFRSETGTYVARQNSFICIPKGGLIHAFKNLTGSPAKLLCTVMPAGLDEFFRELHGFMQTAQEAGYPEEKIKENLDLISEKYGQQIYPPDYFD